MAKKSDDKKQKENNDSGEGPDVLKGQSCPICNEKTLILTEEEREIPYFGKVYIFSMTCESCKFHKADVESVEEKEPVKYTFEMSSEDDLKIRVVKSSQAIVKIPHVGSIEPGETSNGYVTNIEGLLNRIKQQIESLKDDEDDETRKKAKNLLKKLNRAMWGQEKLKIIIEDPTGNSAIITDKAVVEKLKKKAA